MTNGFDSEVPTDPEPPMRMGTPGELIDALQLVTPDMDMPLVVSAGGDNFIITDVVVTPEGVVGLFAIPQEN